MAEESANSSGAWWGSVSGLVNAAKNKSAEVLEFMKRDLDELSTTVKNEATNVVSTTSAALKESFSLDDPESTANNMKRSVSTFLGTVSNVLNPVPEDEDEVIIIKNDAPLTLTRFQSRLNTMVARDETFISVPEGQEAAQFSAWLDIQEDILNSSKLSNYMIMFPEIRAKYSSLVPSQVSHGDFWKHFLFRKALLEDEEARWEAAEARKEAESKQEIETGAEASESDVKPDEAKDISKDLIPHEFEFSDTFKVRFKELLSNEETLTVLLQGQEAVRYKAWLDIQEEEVSRSNKKKYLIAAFPELNEIRSRLVPQVMSNTDFWRRVWFHKALLEDELASGQVVEAKSENKKRKMKGETVTEVEATAGMLNEDSKSSDPKTNSAEIPEGEEELQSERHRLETLRADEYEDYLLSQGVSENEKS